MPSIEVTRRYRESDKGKATALRYYIKAREKINLKQKEYRDNNKEKVRKATQLWTEKNKERIKTQVLKRKYNLLPGLYDKIYQQQDGKCVLCQRQKKLFVDHSHETGRVRALLCARCNGGLGWVEKQDFVIKAQKYLREWLDG